MTVSPWSAAARLTASHNSSGTRTVRCGVAGWFGTAHTLPPGVHTPGESSAPRQASGCWGTSCGPSRGHGSPRLHGHRSPRASSTRSWILAAFSGPNNTSHPRITSIPSDTPRLPACQLDHDGTTQIRRFGHSRLVGVPGDDSPELTNDRLAGLFGGHAKQPQPYAIEDVLDVFGEFLVVLSGVPPVVVADHCPVYALERDPEAGGQGRQVGPLRRSLHGGPSQILDVAVGDVIARLLGTHLNVPQGVTSIDPRLDQCREVHPFVPVARCCHQLTPLPARAFWFVDIAQESRVYTSDTETAEEPIAIAPRVYSSPADEGKIWNIRRAVLSIIVDKRLRGGLAFAT